MDFIIGGKHAPWYVALEKGFYAKRGLGGDDSSGHGFGGYRANDRRRRRRFRIRRYVHDDRRSDRAAHRVQAVGQFGYVGATILWREEGAIKSIKDLQGKSLAISPGQAQWYLMPAYCRINKIDFKSIKIQETAAPIQPAALVTKKADFIIMFRGSNDEVAEQAASKVGVKLSRVFMKDTGLDIYGSSLIVKEEDIKKRPEFGRAYVEGTMEGLRYARDNQEETLKILLKHKPELDPALTTLQLKKRADGGLPAARIGAGRHWAT